MTTIRAASADDLVTLAALTAIAHKAHADNRPDLFVGTPSPEALEALLISQLADPHVTFLIAEAPDGQPIGYAMAELIERHGSALTVGDSVISLRQIAVDPSVSRSGVGSALLEEVREIGRAAGCRRLVTQVWDFNAAAHAFYQTSGLRLTTRALDQEL
ncbi:GNAT family N-acetyltransferase [Kitasatospora sp. NPDC059577]|uniref:GNAT family N-acetyltransferase n=1 Tax=Kitasatospora sp. NPDC059577 TaxID=3346873 RepID=UPI00367AE2E9